eukprot:6201886-Pleurochrysis_carterae.AAC.1
MLASSCASSTPHIWQDREAKAERVMKISPVQGSSLAAVLSMANANSSGLTFHLARLQPVQLGSSRSLAAALSFALVHFGSQLLHQDFLIQFRLKVLRVARLARNILLSLFFSMIILARRILKQPIKSVDVVATHIRVLPAVLFLLVLLRPVHSLHPTVASGFRHRDAEPLSRDAQARMLPLRLFSASRVPSHKVGMRAGDNSPKGSETSDWDGADLPAAAPGGAAPSVGSTLADAGEGSVPSVVDESDPARQASKDGLLLLDALDRWLRRRERGARGLESRSPWTGFGVQPERCTLCLLYTSPSPRDGLLS